MENDKAKVYDDPTNRIVCVFETEELADQARSALVDYGFEPQQVKLLSGKSDAAKMDTSAKWFADTDQELKRFEREIRRGFVALAVPVKDSDCRKDVNEILQSHDAHHVTHFGDWVTEGLR